MSPGMVQSRSPFRRNRLDLFVGPSGAVVLNQTAVFPTLTPANAGGFRPLTDAGFPVALTGTVSTVSGTPTRAWTIASGYLVANGTPDVDNGVVLGVTTVSGRTVEITIDATLVGYACSQWSEVATAFAVGASLDGRAIVLRCGATFTVPGDYNFTGNIRNWAGAGLVIRPDRLGMPMAAWPVISGSFRFNTTVASAGPVECYGITFYRPFVQNDERPISYAMISMIDIMGSGTFKALDLHDNQIYSDLAPSFSGNYLISNFAGVAVRNSGVATDNIKVRNNLIRNVNTGIYLRCGNALIQNNTVTNIYTDDMVVQGISNVKILNNVFSNGIGCYGTLHPDVIHFQPVDGISDLLVEGNIYLPGEWWNTTRGGGLAPATGGATIAVNTTLTAAAHAGSQITATAPGVTITLPDPATMPEQTIWLAGNNQSPTIACPYPSDIAFPFVLSSNVQGGEFAVRASSDGLSWTYHPVGLRLGIAVRKTVVNPVAPDNNCIILYDVADGNINVTLPTGGGFTSLQVAMYKPVTGRTVTINAGAGETITGGPLIINAFWQWYQLTKVGSVWTATIAEPSQQGLFSNYFYRVSPARGVSNLVMRNNIILLYGATHGITLYDDENDGVIVENNTVISSPGDPLERWPSYMPSITMYAAAAVTTRRAFAGRNLCAGLVQGWGRSHGNTALNLSGPATTYAEALALYDTYFQGTGFNATTRAGIVEMLRPEAAYAATGAVPATDGQAGRFNWTTMARVPDTAVVPVRAYPAQGSAIVPVDLDAWLDLDRAVNLGVGAVTLRRASTDANQTATVTREGNRLRIVKTGLLTATEYYVQVASDAVASYAADCFVPAIAKGKWNFTTNASAYENKLWFWNGSNPALDLSSWSDGGYRTFSAGNLRFDTAGTVSGTRFYPSSTGTWKVSVKKAAAGAARIQLWVQGATPRNLLLTLNPNSGALSATSGGAVGSSFGVIDGGADWEVWFKADGPGMTRYYLGLHESGSTGTVEYRRPMLVNANDANAFWIEPFGNWVP